MAKRIWGDDPERVEWCRRKRLEDEKKAAAERTRKDEDRLAQRALLERASIATDLEEYFAEARGDSRHLGLGDISLTLAQQEELVFRLRAGTKPSKKRKRK